MKMAFAYVSCNDSAEAERIARSLLRKKIAACANIFPVRSLYLWKGNIEEGKEAVLIMKAPEKNYQAIRKEVKALHSYEIPFIGKIAADANREYAKWMREALKEKP
jgi:periplasmic divalent cation tolerance protein